MTTKMNVVKLRKELSKRGLDTSGLKPALVARLDAAVAEEDGKKQSPTQTPDALIDKGMSTSGGEPSKEKIESGKEEKRKRTSTSMTDGDDDRDDAKPTKRIKLADVSKLSLADIKAALFDRGLPSTGVKKDLVQQLSKALEAENSDLTDRGVSNEEPEKKMVVALKKGRAILDPYLPDTVKQGYHVFEDKNGSEVYDAMLNQTNVGDNNNKFFVIQLLQSDSGNGYYVYTRWGRVGAKGQNKLFGPYGSSNDAIAEFEGKFFDKTKNDWSERHNFVAYPKKYTWLEMDYEEKDDDKDSKEEGLKSATIQVNKPVVAKQSKLDMRVEKFINLICNVNMMKQMMMEIGYDARKMPLGKLSKSTILKGYAVLKNLATALEDKSTSNKRNTLQQLSSEFYTIIPHDFGFKKMQHFVIDTVQKLKMKLEMVEALGEIELATKLLSNDNEEDDDAAYTHYKRLNCGMEPINSNSHEFDIIKQYVENTHGKTHSNYKLDLLQVFKIEKDGEAERFRIFEEAKNRMLLWHGSRLSNWTGILAQGLRIAPPEAPVTGYMFGKGVYFADMVSKSANYCYTSHTDPIGVLLLCEVALGDMRELYQADYNADNLPNGKLSTKGVGRTAPNPKEYTSLEDGVVVPSGKPLEKQDPKASLQYNEYIVYDQAQIRMRYLLQVRFDYSRR